MIFVFNKKKFKFLDKLYNVLLFLSEIIMIIFFSLIFKTSKENKFDNVSKVLPDFDIIMNKIF